MKISEMTNEQATETLIRLSTPFSNLCDNDELVEILTNALSLRKEPPLKVVGKILPKLITYGLKEHKYDVYEIVAALQGVPMEKVADMNFKETVDFVRNSYDEILRDFFSQSADTTKQ